MVPINTSAVRPTQIHGAAVSTFELNPPSNNLWIGNVSSEVNETELRALFEKHGKIDSVTLYPSRNYAFVYYRDVESARAAKQSLQGYLLRANTLKIEFAKLAKPCKSLWVAGISQSISKEELEREFLKYGKLLEFRFLRDRNIAYVDYATLEDAVQALKSVNGKRIGGDQLRVDFLRSQFSKREPGLDAHFPHRNAEPSDFRMMGQDPLNIYSEPSHIASNRQHFLSIGPRDSLHSNVLRINYPPSTAIEEDMLHNAMILFGEIENIKTFADMNVAFVEFRSVEEARRAKEGLQGKLFNDPRISIEYSISEVGLENDHIGHYPGAKGNLREFPFQPGRVDILGVNHSLIRSNNSGHMMPLGIRGADAYMRPILGPHNTSEPTHLGSEFSDSSVVHNLQSPNPQTLMRGPTWRRSSPTSAILSPSAGFNLSNRSGAWSAVESSQLQRESKRLRSDSGLQYGRMENQGGFEEQYGLSSQSGGGFVARVSAGGTGHHSGDSDCIWRGIIAKGGTLVCHARCVSIGERLDADIPDVVNCSARTGLDLLSKHYDDAIGFNIVFFLPDSEEDFAPYTEFLRYLGSKDRAGVAKFGDGTTLFLVPPSDFLTKVLKVSGPERLYGVILKFPQLVSSSISVNPQSVEPQYVDPHKNAFLQSEYNTIPHMERTLPVDYSRVMPEDSKVPVKPPGSLITNSFTSNPVPPSVVSQAGLALTPELIATLTSLLPTNSSSSSQISSLPQSTSSLGLTSKISGGPSDVAHWKQEHQLVQPLGSQIHQQSQHVPQALTPAALNISSHFQHPVNSYSQIHDQIINYPSQAIVSSNLAVPENHQQSGTVTQEINQPYQHGSSQDILKGHGVNHETDASRFYGSTTVQQQAYPMASNRDHGYDVSQPQPYMPLTSEVDPMQQAQLRQTATYGTVPESTETEADKNERYKTTLLFAANLLSRIHQPSGSQPGQGAGSN